MTTDQLVIGESTADSRDPVLRLSKLLDENSIVPLRESDDGGVLAVKGRINGVTVFGYGTDARLMGGSLATAGSIFAAMIRARLVEERERGTGGVRHAGVVGEVITPVDMRSGLAEEFADATPARGRHGNLPL